MHPAYTFVTVDDLNSDQASKRISGSLYPFYENKSLSAVLDASVDQRVRLSLVRKAKWCYQLALTMEHVHYKANSWHQDVKPPNALINNNDDLLLIDFEQVGACTGFLAPEAN
jgi:serine/threonine protein kinase